MQYPFCLGLILFESTQPTTHDDSALSFILTNVRAHKFPETFIASKKENILIKMMLSHTSEDRPTAENVHGEIRKLLLPESKGMNKRSN